MIRVEGLTELRRALKRLQDDGLKAALTVAHKDLARSIVEKAEPNVPVRTGRLRASVRSSGTQAAALGRVGGSAIPYAQAIHWGKKRGGFIQARPFLTDAAAEVEQGAVDTYTDAVQAVIDRIIG